MAVALAARSAHSMAVMALVPRTAQRALVGMPSKRALRYGQQVIVN